MNGKKIFAATAALTALALTGAAVAVDGGIPKSYQGPGGPLNDNATSAGVTRFDIFVPDHGQILDFKAVNLDIAHTWVGDLNITLIHKDSGTAVTLVDRPGVPESTFGNSDDLNGLYSFQDGFAPLPNASGATGLIDPGTYGLEPGNSLDAFNGLDKFGDWSLVITDNAGGDTGTLFGWEIVLNNVPAPGALALIGLAGLVGGRRRR